MVDTTYSGAAETSRALEGLVEVITQVGWVTWGFKEEQLGGAIISGLERHVRNCLSDMVKFTIQTMGQRLSDDAVQGLGVRLLLTIAELDEDLKQTALANGAIQAISQVLGAYTARPDVLAPALKAASKMKGLAAYIEVLPNILHSRDGCRTALSTIVAAMVRGDEQEVAALPKEATLQTILQTADQHKEDCRLICDAFEILDKLLADDQYRILFWNMKAYEWLLQVLAMHFESPQAQTKGCRIISVAASGGCLSEAYMGETMTYFRRIFQTYQHEEDLMSWAFWAVQKLNGVQALVRPIIDKKMQGTRILRTAMTSIRCMSFTQCDGAAPEHMPSIVDAALKVLESSNDRDTAYESVTVLGRAGSAILGSSLPEQQRQVQLPHAGVAVEAILKVLEQRITDAQMVMTCLRGLKEVLDSCNEDQALLRRSLTQLISSKKDARGAGLVESCISAHCSHDLLQSVVLELRGALEGVRAVLSEMQNHSDIESVQLSGARALGSLYEQVDLDDETRQLAVPCLQQLARSMEMAKENHILQQHSCFAMYAIMEAVGTDATVLPDEACVLALQAAVSALASVANLPDKDQNTGSWDAMYVRKESMRCLGGCLQARPLVCQSLQRIGGLAAEVMKALETTASNVWDGHRDEDLEETLTLELIALSSFQPLHCVLAQALARWGAKKPAVVRATADAACELMRGANTRPPSPRFNETEAVFMVVAALDNPRQALASTNFASKLCSCVQTNFPEDERLVEQCTLTSGFLAHVPAGLPFCPA